MSKRLREDDMPTGLTRKYLNNYFKPTFFKQKNEQFCIYYATQTFILFSPFVRANERALFDINDFRCPNGPEDGYEYCAISALKVLNRAKDLQEQIVDNYDEIRHLQNIIKSKKEDNADYDTTHYENRIQRTISDYINPKFKKLENLPKLNCQFFYDAEQDLIIFLNEVLEKDLKQNQNIIGFIVNFRTLQDTNHAITIIFNSITKELQNFSLADSLQPLIEVFSDDKIRSAKDKLIHTLRNNYKRPLNYIVIRLLAKLKK